MDHFTYRNHKLHCEDVPVEAIASEAGTPVYIYSDATIRHHYRQLADAFAEVDPLICFSVKTNANGSVLKVLCEEGAGFDVVSGGELFRALRAGADPSRIVFAGVGKTEREIRYALEQGILMFNVESRPELEAVSRVASGMGVTARVALRCNPDVDPKTHSYITTGKKENKFGIDFETARSMIANWTRFPHTALAGLHMHIGSQIVDPTPYGEAARRIAAFLRECRDAGHEVEYFNIGGGFGVYYDNTEARTAHELAESIVPVVKETGCRLVMEPGRFVMANAGILVARVLYVKTAGDKRFVIVDAAMTDLIRPSLYGSYHFVWPAESDTDMRFTPPTGLPKADVVGGVCESGDFLAKDRPLPEVTEGDLLSVFSAGAYGYVMSSTYNSRPRAAEVLVTGERWRVVRRRETYEDLVVGEELGG